MNLKDMRAFIKARTQVKGDRNDLIIIDAAIQQAYIKLSEKDCSVKEIEITGNLANITVPSDYLRYLTTFIYTSTGAEEQLGKYLVEIKSNTMMIRKNILDQYKPQKIKLVYGRVPDKLVNEDDVPVINALYHMGICYYAIFLLTNDKVYYELFNMVYDSIPENNSATSYYTISEVMNPER